MLGLPQAPSSHQSCCTRFLVRSVGPSEPLSLNCAWMRSTDDTHKRPWHKMSEPRQARQTEGLPISVFTSFSEATEPVGTLMQMAFSSPPRKGKLFAWSSGPLESPRREAERNRGQSAPLPRHHDPCVAEGSGDSKALSPQECTTRRSPRLHPAPESGLLGAAQGRRAGAGPESQVFRWYSPYSPPEVQMVPPGSANLSPKAEAGAEGAGSVALWAPPPA